MSERVAVVGGGAVGVTAAHDLAERGADVTLFERGELASGSSGRAAGIVYDAVAEDVDAAVADRALERFRALDADGAIDFRDCPYVWFARAGDEHRARAVRESAERMRANGRDVTALDPDELAERFPALGGVDVEAAAVARDAGYLEPASYVRAMSERVRAAGATVETGTPATIAERGDDGSGVTVETPSGRERFDAVLVAAGAHSKRLLADAGVAIPMKPYRVQALVTGSLPAVERDGVPITYDATGGFYLRPHEAADRRDGLLVGDGTEEREFDPDDYDADADPEFVAASRDRVRETLGPDAVGAEVTVERAWAGLCTATPDRNPLLGPVGDGSDVYVATGWHGGGFMRAPATGERVADQILGGDGIEGFDPRRFDGDEAFEVVEGMTVDE